MKMNAIKSYKKHEPFKKKLSLLTSSTSVKTEQLSQQRRSKLPKLPPSYLVKCFLPNVSSADPFFAMT